MKKKNILIVLIILQSCLSHAEPTLFANIKRKFELGTLPNLNIYSSVEGKITAGRCVESTLPNKLYGAYFVGKSVENDPFVQFSGIANYSDLGVEYYDRGHGTTSGYISNERAPFVLQNDGKSYQAETIDRTLYSIRSNGGVLLVRMQLFQQDTEVLCYFNRSTNGE